MKRTFRVVLGALLIMLLAAPAFAQTLGYKLPSSTTFKEGWTCDVASGDSISTYFIIPAYTDQIVMHLGGITAGGIAFEAAVDTSHYAGGFTLGNFLVVKTMAAVIDTLATSSGSMVVDITDQCAGAAAIRFHIGYNSVAAQGGARRFYVNIRKKPPE